MRIAIAGFGDLGSRVARRLRDHGHPVLGLRRTAVASEPCIETRAVDINTLAAGSLADWHADTLLVALSADERSPAGYRRAYLDPLPRLADALGGGLRRSVLVSSTAVFGDAANGLADETTPARPSRWNGEYLLQAESVAAGCLPGLQVVRPAGIYGPGRRHLLQQALDGVPGDGRWTNRIHVEDAAAALVHLLMASASASLYCLTDDHPAPEHQVLDGLRTLQGRPAVDSPDTTPRGRRISNARLRATGWRPVYPSWREGYAALLSSKPA
jgi:nucleoside-diphosphate-sugar epimerase